MRPPVGRDDGLLQVFVRGIDGNLYAKAQLLAPGGNLSWGGWQFLGGPVRGSVC